MPHRCSNLLFRSFGPEADPEHEVPALPRDFHRHAEAHTVVPVWTELLADLETPVAAYVKLVGDQPGFLLESVEGAERWARFSFVGAIRRPCSSCATAWWNSTACCRTASRPIRGCSPLEALLAKYTSPQFDDLPPLHGGHHGLPRLRRDPGGRTPPRHTPRTDRGYPDAVMSVIVLLAAFDHWRQRVYLIESVPTLGLDAGQLDEAYDAVVERVRRRRCGPREPLPYTPVEPPSADDVLPDLRSSMPDGMYRGPSRWPSSRRRRRHLPGGARPALRPRPRGRPLRCVPGVAPGQSVAVHVLREPSRIDDRGLVARADGAAARAYGRVATDRRHTTPWPHRRARPDDGRRADRTPEGTRRARDAGRSRPQRRRPRR